MIDKVSWYMNPIVLHYTVIVADRSQFKSVHKTCSIIFSFPNVHSIRNHFDSHVEDIFYTCAFWLPFTSSPCIYKVTYLFERYGSQ